MDALTKLAEIRNLNTARDTLLVQARIEGNPWSAICEASGLTETTVIKLAKKANGGTVPQPGGVKLKPGARIRTK